MDARYIEVDHDPDFIVCSCARRVMLRRGQGVSVEEAASAYATARAAFAVREFAPPPSPPTFSLVTRLPEPPPRLIHPGEDFLCEAWRAQVIDALLLGGVEYADNLYNRVVEELRDRAALLPPENDAAPAVTIYWRNIAYEYGLRRDSNCTDVAIAFARRVCGDPDYHPVLLHGNSERGPAVYTLQSSMPEPPWTDKEMSNDEQNARLMRWQKELAYAWLHNGQVGEADLVRQWVDCELTEG